MLLFFALRGARALFKMNTPPIIVADDHPMFREASAQLLQRLAPESSVLTTDTVSEIFALLRSHSGARLVLLDLSLPDSVGIEGLQRLKNSFPDIPVVIISATTDAPTISRAMKAGALGFVPKSESMITMYEAFETTLKGEEWLPKAYLELVKNASDTAVSIFNDLTPTQLKVLSHMRQGENNKTIAEALFVTEATVKAHVTAIFRKLDVKNRTQAVLLTDHLDLA
jgi:DNA-binding NarL/FixJ family response regulator